MALRHDPKRGVVFMLLACALFAGMSVLVKDLAGRVHFLEQMFFRSFFALPVVVLIVVRRIGLRGDLAGALRTRRFPGHVLRAMTGTAAQACSFYALAHLPLAEHTALTNTTPLFVTLLSIPLLGEKVGIHRGGAVVAGFCGIVVIALGQGAFTGDFGGAARWGILAALAHGMFSAGTTMLVRTLSATESSGTIVLWQSLLMTFFSLFWLPFVWVTPSVMDLLMLVAIGLIGGAAQTLLTEAWASAQVSFLAPYSYSALLWAVLFGWIVFGDVPGLATLAGALAIVLASLYIMHREIVLRGRKR
ncbi:DMT family transporter [Falsiroseomonas tokyonensis]|uniref:DMT family transporter n=1 Tax=Falsiroseomonas tokyonensis TaxID=430521 RepID=A0ABV7BV26_9PROT|nr:DMT family transporter [Falsiroseomonas tokyonensis]MBU8538481.1 DMT family transporter [Falsiroseomonas tokyonensis]